MNYKDIAVINEKKFRAENDNLRKVLNEVSEKNIRLQVLLHNAMVLLEELNMLDNLVEELGITEKEYKEIMK